MKTINDNIKSILSLLVTSFSFGLFTLICLQHAQDKELISQILIAVVGSMTGITGYYYGYSQGASKKDEAQAKQIENGTGSTVGTADTVNIKK